MKNYIISKYFFLAFIFQLISCSDNEVYTGNNENAISGIKQYKAKYMEFPVPLSYSITEANPEIVELEYNNSGQVIKKNGDILYTSPNSGILYLLSKQIYATVQYSNNKILIEKQFIDPNYTSNYKKEIFISNDKIDKIVKYNPSESPYKDTLVYSYNNQKINKIITRNIYPKEEAIYYYNSQNNLDSIVTRGYQYNPITNTDYIDYSSKGRRKVIFKDYDTAFNPTKNLFIFDETYYRSLSSNNYKTIIYQSFNINGDIIANSEKNWNLIYLNGQVDFSQ